MARDAQTGQNVWEAGQSLGDAGRGGQLHRDGWAQIFLSLVEIDDWLEISRNDQH
jgi:hypothetical protein